jgi:hypothetical protein
LVIIAFVRNTPLARLKYPNLIKIKVFLFHEVYIENGPKFKSAWIIIPHMMPSRILVMVPYRIFCHYASLRIEKLHAAFIIIAQTIEIAAEIAL